MLGVRVLSIIYLSLGLGRDKTGFLAVITFHGFSRMGVPMLLPFSDDASRCILVFGTFFVFSCDSSRLSIFLRFILSHARLPRCYGLITTKAGYIRIDPFMSVCRSFLFRRATSYRCRVSLVVCGDGFSPSWSWGDGNICVRFPARRRISLRRFWCSSLSSDVDVCSAPGNSSDWIFACTWS